MGQNQYILLKLLPLKRGFPPFWVNKHYTSSSTSQNTPSWWHTEIMPRQGMHFFHDMIGSSVIEVEIAI
jgi:hypothetical protein